MTVQELIKRLEALPPECQVLVEGYENGWDTLIDLQIANLTRQQPCEDWDGEFERVAPDTEDAAQCVLLVGRRVERRG
jgi:hypothetical protein